MNNKLLMSIAYILLIVVLLLPTASCEPAPPFQITNKTDQTLYIFITGSYSDHVEANEERVLRGEVKAGEILRPDIFPFPTFLIEARDEKGNVVYSGEFSYRELESIDWKVTISKSQR